VGDGKACLFVESSPFTTSGLFGSGATIKPATNPPSAPSGVTAVAGQLRITVSWSPSAGATSYNLYRSSSPSGEGGSPYLTGVTSPFIDTGLIEGVTWYYTVTAVNGTGESSQSSEVSATTTDAYFRLRGQAIGAR